MRNSTLRAFVTFLFSLTCFMASFAQSERMFHIARSVNSSIVCYDVNMKGGKLNLSSPIHVYWYGNENGVEHTNELSYIQRKLAYGYKVVKTGADWAEVTLSAYPKRSGIIKKINGKYAFTININGKPSRLNSIYVKAKGTMSVDYIELIGTALADGTKQVERINK